VAEEAVKTLLLLAVTLLAVLLAVLLEVTQEVPLVVTQVQKVVTQVPLVMLGQALELQVKEALSLTQDLLVLQEAST
jgi:hypothetical protein